LVSAAIYNLCSGFFRLQIEASIESDESSQKSE